MAGSARRAAYFTEVMDDRAEDLRAMLDILRDVGADSVLIGGLAVGFHGYQRATQDVDMLVPARFLNRIATVAREYGYVVRTFKDMIRVWPADSDPDQDESIADFVAAEANPVLRAAFRETEDATVLGQPAVVVRRGPLYALKFSAIVSPDRLIEDKYQDIADVGHIIKKDFRRDDEIAGRRVAALAYPGAGDDFTEFLDDLRSGRPVRI
jgi:hypothetical protein